MNTADLSCSGATRIASALGGAQALLSGFWPSEDQVGLLAFPGMTSATVSKDYTCPTSNPTIVPYGKRNQHQLTRSSGCQPITKRPTRQPA